MTKKRILFTGGSGKAGKHVVPWLLARGYEVHNIDLVPLQVDGVTNLSADITDSGQMFNALSMHRDFPDLEVPGGPKGFDAVVHFAAVPRIMITPDNECFRVNTIGTYNVIEAAAKLGVRKIIIASSETTYGICFAEGHRNPHTAVLDESYDSDPMDSYGLSKVLNEKTARAFAERYGIDIYALRIGNVIEPHEYDRFPEWLKHPERRIRNAWCYIDTRDLAQIVHLCIGKDGLGYQAFNATNDHVVSDIPTKELAARFWPGVGGADKLGEFECPITNRKAKEVLGFREEHNFRQYL